MIPVEEIPDTDWLFYRVHVNLVRSTNGKLNPNCFRDLGGGMSTDWSRYGSAGGTRAAKGPQRVFEYGIARLGVGPVRMISGTAR